MNGLPELTYDYVNSILSYDSESGTLIWKTAKQGRRVGNIAGCIRKAANTSYRQVLINKKNYQAHRLAWLIFYREWPKNHIDHINQDGLDNSIKNLRDVPHKENMKNARKQKNNTSGITGVIWKRSENRWIAKIYTNGKEVYLGSYRTLFAASYARHAANIKYGFHVNHGLRN